MKDYYKILGVGEEASGEEIRARWAELTKRYHPDLRKGDGEAYEKIKEINEAYEVLRNDSKRFDYDLERVLRSSLTRKAEDRKERRMDIRKIILPAGILVLCIVVGLFIFKWLRIAVPPKSEVSYKIDRVLQKENASPIPPPPLSVKEESKRKEGVSRRILPRSEVPVEVGNEIPEEMTKEIPEERSKVAEKESKQKEELAPQVIVRSETPVKAEPPKQISNEGPKQVSREVPKDSKEVPKEINQVLPQESAKMDQPKPAVTESPPPPKPEIPAKVEPARPASIPLPPPLAKESEVKQFFADYRDQYTRRDVDRFLSLFSTRAIQNQKDGFERIRKIYTNFFDQSRELTYRLEDAKIEIYQNSVEVKARFRVDQILKKGGEEKVWRGNIRWVLTREEGALKIVSLDYRNEKPSQDERGEK